MHHSLSRRFSFIVAVVLHLLLFLLLFARLSPPHMPSLTLQPDVDIIKAVAVNSADVAARLTQLKTQEQAKRRQAQEEADRQQQQLAQAAKAKQQKEQAAKKIAQQQAEAAALLERQQVEQKSLEQKRLKQAAQKQQAKKAEAEKKLAAENTKQAQEKEQQSKKEAEKKRQQKAAEELKLAQQQALESQMAAEQKQLEAAHTNQQQSEIEKYTGLILHTMRQNWIEPEGVSPDISCQLAIQLNADGTVVNVTLLRSSGNSALDNSARLAVFKSSPLPVPADPSLFKQVFREFTLTASLKDLQS